jgi:hypothetical protein
MLRIERAANDSAVYKIIGRLGADNLGELFALLNEEPAGRTVVFDLKDLLLVDREAVRFLSDSEARNIVLRNCPAYIRVWIACASSQDGANPCFDQARGRVAGSLD